MAYRIVVFLREGEDIEVKAWDYGARRPPEACEFCDRLLPAADPAAGAKQDGLEFGKMLARRGSLTFRVGLLEALEADVQLRRHVPARDV